MEDKLKIALIVPAVDAAGPTIFTRNLVLGLKELTDKVDVFYFKETVSIDLGVPCIRLRYRERYSFDDYDIVHTTMALPDLYARKYVDKGKWISAAHNYMGVDIKMLHNPIKARLILALWKNALQRCNNIIVSSIAMREYYEDYLGKKNYTIIPYGIVEPVYTEIDENDKTIIESLKKRNLTIIGSVGVMIKRKGFDQLLYCLRDNPDYGLIVIGDGEEKQKLEKLSEELGIKDRVLFPGFRNNSHNYYKYFDVYAHVSYSEGFGIAMLEALSKGVPIVCSKLDIYKEYFSENDVCYFIPGNIEDLEKALKLCIDNSDFYNKASIRLFTQYFDYKMMAKRHMEYYKKVSECKNA